MRHAGGGGILCREVPVLRWQPHDTVSASPLASSHRLMPSNHTMFRHKAARCSLSHAAPRAPASPLSLSQPSPALLEGTSASLAPCANIQRTPASVPGSQPCPVPTRGHPTRGYAGSTARRRLQGSGEELRGRHRSGLAQTPPRGAGICSRSTQSPVVTLTPSWPPSRRHRASPCSVWFSPVQATCSAGTSILHP